MVVPSYHVEEQKRGGKEGGFFRLMTQGKELGYRWRRGGERGGKEERRKRKKDCCKTDKEFYLLLNARRLLMRSSISVHFPLPGAFSLRDVSK